MTRHRITTLMFLAAALLLGMPGAPADASPYPVVRLETSMGNIELKLERDKAPITVDNFLRYVKEGFYDGTIFHRVVPDFVIQGGGFTPDFKEKKTHKPIVNESGNGLPNWRGTIAMARQKDPHSATSQFYINLKDNDSLDPQMSRWGYCVFGDVTKGMDVVDKIAAVPTGKAGPLDADVPVKPVIITHAVIVHD